MDHSCGRMVIYENKIEVSFIKTADHDYLLDELANRHKFQKRFVLDDAVRLFFKYEE